MHLYIHSHTHTHMTRCLIKHSDNLNLIIFPSMLLLSLTLGTVRPLYRTGLSLFSGERFYIFNQQIYFII